MEVDRELYNLFSTSTYSLLLISTGLIFIPLNALSFKNARAQQCWIAKWRIEDAEVSYILLFRISKGILSFFLPIIIKSDWKHIAKLNLIISPLFMTFVCFVSFFSL